jgi:hypothetical protein
MKKLIAIVLLTLTVSTAAYSAVRCVPSGGGTCCWDTDRDGPFKPIGC